MRRVRATLAVDTGLGARNGATIMRAVDWIGRRSTLYLVTTHFHPEYAGGDAGFPANTILIRSSVQDQEMKANGQDMMARFSKISPQFAELVKGATLRTPDIVFDREIRLDPGGVTARVQWLGPGHTKGDQLIIVEPDAVLVTGDLVQNKVVPAVSAAGGTIDDWLRILEQARKLSPRIILPDHSHPGDASLITEDRDFIVDMRAHTLDLKKQSVSAADTRKRMVDYFRTKYPAWAASASKEWDNVNVLPGFVQRAYAEAK